uniref:Integrase catalytic domain-containing protein n=1 Tax=Asparagus officinalis TaxID=4686 RepID=Q2AA76_ASPOF|nr:hypothetical protein 18.t00011 [Asparagus officinalis]
MEVENMEKVQEKKEGEEEDEKEKEEERVEEEKEEEKKDDDKEVENKENVEESSFEKPIAELEAQVYQKRSKELALKGIIGPSIRVRTRSQLVRAPFTEEKKKEVHPEIITISHHKDNERKKNQGVETPHDDPLVITVVINGYLVKRIMIDTGSLMDVLYTSAFNRMGIDKSHLLLFRGPLVGFSGLALLPEGMITLTFVLGEYPRQITAQIQFLVAEGPRTEAVDELYEVPIDQEGMETIKIGFELVEPLRGAMVEFLKANTDKKRHLGPERQKAAADEVKRLLKADFIREAQYPDLNKVEDRRINPGKVAVITKWPTPRTVTEVRSFMGACQYLRKFIRYFSTYVAPLHSLSKAKRTFEVETDASSYAMGAVLIQNEKPVEYHSEMFTVAIQNYPTYDKEFYALYQAIKHWRVYLLAKEMSYLMAFNIIIKYKKGTTNKLADMLSRPPVRALFVATHIQPLVPLEYIQMYTSSRDFSSVFEQAKAGRKGEYEIGADGMLYRGTSLCISKDGDRLQWIREAHTSYVQGYFGIQKTLLNLRRYVFWPKMLEDVTKYLEGVSYVAYRSLLIGKWDCIYHCRKMVILIPCKKTVTRVSAAQLFFEHVWKHFGLSNSIISDRDRRFLRHFWDSLWSLMDTRQKKSTIFHPQTDGQTEVVNRTIIYMLRGYNFKHPKIWDESLPYLQFVFNRAIHGSSGKSPFETCYGFLPSSPFDIVFSSEATADGKEGSERQHAQRFLEKIAHIHATVEAQLKKSQSKYKERLKGEGKKLKPIYYGSFRILDQMGDNVFRLDLPHYLGMYSVINAEYLKLFEPPLLDDEGDDKVILPHVEDLWFDREEPLNEDCILERKTIMTRRGTKESFLIRRQGQVPSKTKWFNRERGAREFPQLKF